MKVSSVYSFAFAATAVTAALTSSQSISNRTGAPVAKLDYAAFEGYHDDVYGLDVWKGYVSLQ